jgi:hypothetical protein
MKNIIFLIIALFSLTSYGQQKVRYTGLNKNIPNNLEIGIKGNANIYFSQYKTIEDETAFESSDEISESLGGGIGVYCHFILGEHVGIQTEFNFAYRKGYSTSLRKYDVDTARTIHKEDLSDFTTISIEIPVYLKFHWKFTPIHKGHWKSKSQLGLFFGPRLILNPYSRRELSRSTTTMLYDNTSQWINQDAQIATRYNTIAGLGVALGVDYELWNGFMVHAAFYRGLLTHVNKLNGYKALDNRVEIGLGYRFN